MKPAPNLAASFRSPKARVALAWFLPFIVCLLQWLLWPQIGPSRWFLFYPLAFWNSGLIPNELLPGIMLAQFVTKVAVETLFTPFTYAIVGFLKRAEGVDHYDRNTDFTPFSIKT